LFLYDLIIKIVKNHGRSGKLWTIKRILSTYNVCDLVFMTTVRKFIHSICCVVWHYCQRFSLPCWGKVVQWLPKDWHKKVSNFCKMKFVHVHFAADWMNKFRNRIIKIVKNHGRSGKLWIIKRIPSTYNVCDVVSSTVPKFIHSICCKMFLLYKQLLAFPVIF
jgi:hypothetical protein